MKSINKHIILLACAGMAAAGFQSCVSEEPFGSEDGAVRVKMVINNDLTRAETDNIDLGATTVLYISNSKGLVRKYQGQANIPEKIELKGGHYLAEAWAGDSVSASFDKKFYQGSSEFDINGGDTEVTLRCGIANVVASINKQSAESVGVDDLKITIGHTRGTLDFTKDNLDAKGYFMMPNSDKNLTYTISGTNKDGNAFNVSGEIPEVKKGHEYILNISNNPTYDEIGGAFLLITIDDREILVESEVTILGRPDIKGVGFDISKQLFAAKGEFKDATIKIKAFGGLKNLFVASEQWEVLGLPSSEIDLLNLTSSAAEEMKAKGFESEIIENKEKNTITAYLYLKAAYLNSLNDGNYEMNISATDTYGKSAQSTLRIGVGAGHEIIDDPVVIDAAGDGDLTLIGARSATLTGQVIDATLTPSLEYRESGTDNWTSVSLENIASLKRKSMKKAEGQKFKVTLKNLKPGTRYEYRAATSAFTSESQFFTTESEFTFPNASMEEWSTYSAQTMLGKRNVVFPGSGSAPTFWDSGNEGAATANKTITDKSTEMLHSGTYSVRLGSTSALGILAAGNIFIGDYVKTDGTNGVLSLGREYNGSHPSKLAVWVNYRPGVVDVIEDKNKSFLDFVKNENDHGQIYIALTTAPIEIRTNPDKRKLFPTKSGDEDFDKIVAYGQITWKEAFGADGTLERVEIPFVYNANAKSTKPLYVIVVCCASKFGDFFSGSSKSVMYLDDFELVYE